MTQAKITQSKKLLSQERQITPVTSAVILACALTGLITYFFNHHSVLLQWTVLFHLLTGVFCSLVLMPYFVVHFKRTLGFRRPSLIASGLLSLLLFVLFIYSGWHVLWFGQKENQSWIYWLHVLSSIVFIAILILHIALHIIRLPQKRKTRSEPKLPSIPSSTGKTVFVFNIVIFVFIVFATQLYQANQNEYSSTPIVKDYQAAYGNHPFRPSQTETANHTFIDERQIANSAKCASCHQEVTQQWIASAHKEAASDQTYVTNINLLADKKGIAATRYCEGCHAPIALLTGQLSLGGKHGGIANTPANTEGIACMGCHGIVSLPHLKGVASYEFKAAEAYLFSNSENAWLTRIQNLLIRVKPHQHKRDLGNPLLKDPKICASCHSQFMDKSMNDWGWVKMQDEYTAWAKGPFSKHNNSQFSNNEVARCQDCHMPLVTANDPSANSNGKVRSHHFYGANTLLPALRGDKTHLDATIRFLQSNKMRVSIDKPKRKNTLQSTHSIDEAIRQYEEAPHYYYLGEKAEIQVIISNTGVGHDFPGGSIDINQAWVEFLVMDAAGDTVFSSGLVSDDNYVDPGAYFYRSLPVDRKGQLVWQHDLFNMIGESFKRVIKAGESDIISYSFPIPAWTKSPITISASLKYRKLNERYAKWALKDKYITIPIVNMGWDSLNIPIKIRKEVE